MIPMIPFFRKIRKQYAYHNQLLLENKTFKNGIVLSKYNSDLLIIEYKQMIERINVLIERIDSKISQ